MIITPEHKKLNMGCGFRKLNDHWNVDMQAHCNPDQVVDLEDTFPWEDDFFEYITADNILEHLGATPKIFVKVIQEMYRVSRDGAEWYINVPHHRCDNYWNDFTHVRILTPQTFKMFDREYNVFTIKQKQSDSCYGFDYNVDIEVTDVSYNIVHYWRQQQEEGFLGVRELDIKLNTLANVAESVNIFCKVHKPVRYKNWLKTNY